MTAFRINTQEAVYQEFGEEVVLVHLGTGSYYSFSDTGSFLWQELAAAPAAPEALAARLCRHYAVDPATALQDVSHFLAELERQGLLLVSENGARATPETGAGPERLAYAAPRLTSYSDLQELFLLDPVHDVDPAQGWPHLAPQASPPEAVRRADGDLLVAAGADTIVVVNRDRGVVCRLDGGAAEAWRSLEQGPLAFAAAEVLSPLLEVGVLEPAPLSAARAVDTAAGGTLTVSHDLAEQIRPWGQQRRPARSAASASARSLCERLDTWFEAIAADGAETRQRAVAGRTITVQTPRGDASHGLAAALPGPAGDRESSDGDLLVRAWCGGLDRASPRLANLVESLRSNWRSLCGPRGEVVDLHTETTTAIFNPGPDVLSVLDRQTGKAWCVKLDEQPFPFWEIGSPFRFLLHDHFSLQGLQMVHAAAVADEEAAVLVVGRGGSGKSTTALACAAAGLRYLGDDYCLVDTHQGLVHALYSSGKLVGPDDLHRLPLYRGCSINADSFEQGGQGKAVVLIDSVIAGALTATRPIRAIVLPRLEACRAGECRPASIGDALEAIVPSTLGQLPGSDADDARRLERLCQSVPLLHLALGADAAAIAASVRQVLRQCG